MEKIRPVEAGGFCAGLLDLVRDPTFPTLLAFLEDEEQWPERRWLAWCPFCLDWHAHGAGKKNEDPWQYLGHRAAHCFQNTPLTKTGYLLVFGGHWDALTAEQRRYGPGGKALYQELKREQRD